MVPEINVVAINVGRKCGDQASWEAFIRGIEDKCVDWTVIFLLECDGWLDDRQCEFELMHEVYRYWPGRGSYAMAAIVNNRHRQYVRSIRNHGRAMRIHMTDYKSFNTNLICLHGGHGDALAPSLADAALLDRTKPRGSDTILFGDINVDFLPTLAIDPWGESPERSQRDWFERDLVLALLKTMGIELQIPESSVGMPGGPFSEAALFSLVSRIPVGEQLGLPSLLDYSTARPGLLRKSLLDWDVAIADHAALFMTLSGAFTAFPT